MRAITIEVPEELAERWEALPAEQRNYFAVAALESALSEVEGQPTLSEEDLAAIGRGLADADAGRTEDADTVFADLRQRVGL